MYRAGLVLCVLVVAAWGQTLPEDCGDCDPSLCPAITSPCAAGVTMDTCMCCEVCAKAEYEMCDHPEVARIHPRKVFGKCGDNLECVLRSDIDPSADPEALCYCLHDKTLCGTDGVTYDNLCQLNAAKVEKEVERDHNGPCKTAPILVSPPEDVKDKEGGNISLSCEAKGYPIPVIEWSFTRVDGETKFLPSDDRHLSVSMRGGPEKWEVSGFLLITDIQKEHEGDYACIAQNEIGVDQAIGRVKVEVNKGDKKHKKRERGHKNKYGNDL